MSTKHFLALSLTAALISGCQSNANDELNTEYDRTEAYTEGVPGGAVTETDEMQASVTAIDPAKRSFTLRDDDGNSRTFQAPPEMHNFDQLKVGDRVRAVVALERIVYLRQPGEVATDGAAGVAATAPLGSKPGMLVADTIEITALVKGMDTTLRTATLQLPDGSERTIKVRPDVDMKTEYLGRQVVLRMTSAFAISVTPQ
ncbi:DUF1344 domain-containing protein [Pseudomonas sp. PDM15]|jgi:hypothetical protein|uniref:DUF1344 domain-containing protein n=1 Tax=Pseudomonas sp. PDM15 TaxID=2769303 RepID=UPI001785F266|nr:DUF1344 domain-containing protein [Pseudomonas sp. PDM15]MBD9425925.1 DUF1344 domain-containing protein [Pseudomonas sp. PDM15]